MTRVFLCLGTNLGDRRANMEAMKSAVNGILVKPLRCSRLMETEPVGIGEAQDWFLNQIISGGFEGTAVQLLDSCQSIEEKLGRKRNSHNEPRVADVDILLFGNHMVVDGRLQIPHAGIVQRRFCLEGMCEIDQDALIPGVEKAVKDLCTTMDVPVRQQGIRYLS